MGKRTRKQPVQAFQAPSPVPAWEPKPVVNIDVLGSKNATVARVTLAKHKDWTAQGVVYKFETAESSKREQGDVADPVTGELLALSRAFLRISRQLSSVANTRVKKAAEEKAAAEAAAEAKAAQPVVKKVHNPMAVEGDNASVKYNPHDAQILSRWTTQQAQDVKELRRKKAEIEAALRTLGGVE